MKQEIRYGKPCYTLESSHVSASFTVDGGQMAPVSFLLPGSNAPVEPYHISPWQEDGTEVHEPVLKPLRGDFFCMPFGGEGDEYPNSHGETASGRWECAESFTKDGITSVFLNMKTAVRPGSVTKQIYLMEGQTAVYTRHVITGNSGKISMGHHATLGVHNGPLVIRTGNTAFGLTLPYEEGKNVHNGLYRALAPGAWFSSPRKVPSVWKDSDTVDCTIFPVREGFMDLIQLVSYEGAELGWTAAVCREGGYLWYSLKDPRVLPSTLYWMENKGRYNPPWNGRNSCIGLEDVCSFFSASLKNSTEENMLSEKGVRTYHTLTSEHPFAVSYIQGTAPLPADFDAAASVTVHDQQVVFTAESGSSTAVDVDTAFLYGKQLT